MGEYKQRDHMALDKAGGYYSRHVQAMTSEGLHEKSAIAAELAVRDQEIDCLKRCLFQVQEAAKDAGSKLDSERKARKQAEAERNMWKMKCAEADGNTERVSEERDRLSELISDLCGAIDVLNDARTIGREIDAWGNAFAAQDKARAARAALQPKEGGVS